MSKESEFLKSLKTGDVSRFNELIDEVDLTCCIDDEGQTPAHLAAIYANVGFLKELIARDVDMTAKDEQGYTPIQAMVAHVVDEELIFTKRHVEAARLLLDNGADIKEIAALYSSSRVEEIKNILALFSSEGETLEEEGSEEEMRDETEEESKGEVSEKTSGKGDSLALMPLHINDLETSNYQSMVKLSANTKEEDIIFVIVDHSENNSFKNINTEYQDYLESIREAEKALETMQAEAKIEIFHEFDFLPTLESNSAETPVAGISSEFF